MRQTGHKDILEYENGVNSGGITPEWRQAVEAAATEVLARIEQGRYPFDRSWLDWLPDAGWPRTILPPGWDKVKG